MTAQSNIKDPWRRGHYDGQILGKGRYGACPPKPPLPPHVFNQDDYYYDQGFKRGLTDALRERAGIHTNKN